MRAQSPCGNGHAGGPPTVHLRRGTCTHMTSALSVDPRSGQPVSGHFQISSDSDPEELFNTTRRETGVRCPSTDANLSNFENLRSLLQRPPSRSPRITLTRESPRRFALVHMRHGFFTIGVGRSIIPFAVSFLRLVYCTVRRDSCNWSSGLAPGKARPSRSPLSQMTK